MWAIDGLGNVYISYCDFADSSVVAGDLLVCKYEPAGNRAGVANLPMDGLWSWPSRWLSVTADGSVFLMRPLQHGVAVDRIEFGRKYDSRIEAIEAQWKQELAGLQHRASETGALDVPPDVTRQQVNSNCSLNIGYGWTFNEANGWPVPSGVTKPDWLQTTPYGTAVTGIPYCWGGFDSVDTASVPTWINFGDAMSDGEFAGNINCSGNYKAGTAGLDCAGFVSACAEYGVRYSTYDLWDYESYPISDSQKLYMDIYINRSKHVLFYYSTYSSGINAKECCTDILKDKCQSTTRTWSWVSTKGYSLRRLYAIDPTP